MPGPSASRARSSPPRSTTGMAAHRMIGIRGMADLLYVRTSTPSAGGTFPRREPIPWYFNGLARLAGANRAAELWVAARTSGRKIAIASLMVGGARRRGAVGWGPVLGSCRNDRRKEAGG